MVTHFETIENCLYRNALNDWHVAGCPVTSHLKEELVKVRESIKKLLRQRR